MTPGANPAVDAWRGALGEAAVLTDEASVAAARRNAAALDRRIPCILRPRSVADVQAVVRIARAHRAPVHPVSRGCNWGMGSRLPPRDGTAVVDLSGLDRIREVNAPGRYAVVEADVTQGQLHRRLAGDGLPLIFNVTGSSTGTSLVGNSLDRGVGYFDSRATLLSGLEVVLGTGEVIRTGFGHYDGARTTHLYRHGIGPWLDGLFAQGNFGIVTAAGVELLPKPERETAVIARIDREDALPALIDAFAGLRRRGVIGGVAHIGNRARSWMTLAPLLMEQLVALRQCPADRAREAAEAVLAAEGFGPWSAVAGIAGPPRMQAIARAEIRRSLRGIARVIFLGAGLRRTAERLLAALRGIPACARKLALLRAVTPVQELALGIPTDDTLPAVGWAVPGAAPSRDDPDRGDAGLLYCLPIVPADGAFVREALDAVLSIFARYGFEAAITVNLLDDRSMEGVISLAFRRDDPARAAAAQSCIREAEEDMLRRGCPPYRVGLGSMDLVVRPDDPFWQTVRSLKTALDPDGVISPGRYNLA
ncbi:MAG: FAD-binding oxidoreductase [Lentisphaerae bacterium]|nr:FAD-binding oxidoreductase [Lentisphaerota bacterium]